MSCFVVGQMKGLTNTQLILYGQASNTFLRIQEYDAAIRSKRLAGNKKLSYYTFQAGEQALYNMGQFLLIQNDPVNTLLYQSVEKV